VVYYSSLVELLPKDLACHFFDSIESTNLFLANRPFTNRLELCVTREQTQGKGQFGRHWESQRDNSILFSIRRNFPKETNLNGLSLVAGLAIVKVLEKQCLVEGFKIKWPNDIYFENKKLAGVLLENQMQSGNQSVVIGVGINYSIDEAMIFEIPWTDLAKITKTLPDIKLLTAEIINNILVMSEHFSVSGFDGFRSDWKTYDMLQGKKVKCSDLGESFEGEVIGVSAEGALKIFTKNGVKELYSSRHIEYI
jgi:BirA family biotin operon repressor/biotin-[acetyl-CoA-carboxylase] ligase